MPRESLKMEFPKPTSDIKEVNEKYYIAEEEKAEKNGKKAKSKSRGKNKK
jgi:hypothetical protein